jgi:hypothetical protein
MKDTELHDELLAADMRFKWAMKEFEKYRIENERLKEEVVQLRRYIGELFSEHGIEHAYIKYYGED